MKVKLSELIRSQAGRVFREVGDAIEGDHILVECRKPAKKWSTVRGFEQHHYYATALRKNAFAVVVRAFTNVRQKDDTPEPEIHEIIRK